MMRRRDRPRCVDSSKMAAKTSDGFSELVRANRKTRNAALLRVTTELYALDRDHSADQRRRYEELATHLLPEAPLADRVFIAECLADIEDAPVAILRMLARDVLEVAEPVITKSPALGTFDLLSAISATGPEHHRLIARRPHLPADVARALDLVGNTAAGEPAPPTDAKGDGPAATATKKPAQPHDRAPVAGAAESAHRDAWSFLALDREQRLRLVAELASRPLLVTDRGQGADKAFEKIVTTAQVVGYAGSRRTEDIIGAIAKALKLPAEFVAASINDQTGEPLAILLKALRLDDATARQVFLMMSPVGRDVARFFPLSDFHSGMEPVVAEALVSQWREADAQPAGHKQITPDVAGRRRDRTREHERDPRRIDEAGRAQVSRRQSGQQGTGR